MKNKIIIIILIILGVAFAVLAGVYFIKYNNSPINSFENTGQPDQNSVPENPVSEIQGGVKNDAGANNQKNTEQPQNKLVTDDFEITLPAGWKRADPPMGASAMAVNMNENLNDPAAQKINFKSYVAVSYDTLQGKSLSEYLQGVKSQLQQTISNVVFAQEHDTTINGRSARAIEAELIQQGVTFKILMVVIAGQGKDVWVISFNTTKSSWDGYKETFSDIVKSFSLKK